MQLATYLFMSFIKKNLNSYIKIGLLEKQKDFRF